MCHIRIRIFVSNFPLLTKKKALLMFRVYVNEQKKTLECILDVLKEERETIVLFVLSLFVHSKNNNESRRPLLLLLLLLLICRLPLGRCS